MKRMLKKSLSLLLCAAMVALGLSALLFSCHECTGETCAVCLAIGEALRISRAAAVLALAVMAITHLASAVREADCLSFACPISSLILMKTELLN